MPLETTDCKLTIFLRFFIATGFSYNKKHIKYIHLAKRLYIELFDSSQMPLLTLKLTLAILNHFPLEEGAFETGSVVWHFQFLDCQGPPHFVATLPAAISEGKHSW